MVIFRDYTDVTMSAVGVIGTVTLLSICTYALKLPEVWAYFISLIFFLTMFLFALRMSYESNSNCIFAIFSALIKIVAVCGYILVMLFLVFWISPQKEGEPGPDFEMRRKREARERNIMMAAATAFFIWLIHSTTKYRGWTPVSYYFALSRCN